MAITIFKWLAVNNNIFLTLQGKVLNGLFKHCRGKNESFFFFFFFFLGGGGGGGEGVSGIIRNKTGGFLNS